MNLEHLVGRCTRTTLQRLFAATVLLTSIFAGGHTALAQVPVTSGLVLHLEADSGITTTGPTVTAWADQSTQANNLSATGNPQLVSAGTPTGLDYIALDGAGDWLDSMSFTGLPTGASDRTIFFVVRYIQVSTFAGLGYGNGASNQAFGTVVNGGSGNLTVQGFGGGNDFASGVAGTGAGWLTQSIILSSSQTFHFKGNTQIDTDAHVFNTGTTRLVIGEEIAGFGNGEQLDVAAALVYDRALTTQEHLDVEAYLNSKYLQAAGAGPIADDDAAIVDRGASVAIDVTANDTAADSPVDVTTVALGSVAPVNGIVLINPTTGVVTYTHGGSLNLSDTFTYTVDDTDGDTSNEATVSIGVFDGDCLNSLPTSGLVLRLESDSGVTTAGSSVTAWADQSASGNHLAAAVGSEPTLVTAGLNGQDYIAFDGTNDMLDRTASITGLATGSADRSMFLVARYIGNTTFAGLSYGNGASNQTFGLVVNGNGGQLTVQGFGGGNDFPSGVAGTGAGWLAQSVVYEAGMTFHYKDGALIDSDVHNFNTVSSRIVLAEEIANGGFIGVDVAAGLVYSSAISEVDRLLTDCYLDDKYFTPPNVAVCGNSIVESGEACDDGNTVGGDCCSAICQLETGGSCDDGDVCTETDTCTASATCVGAPKDCSASGDACNDGVCNTTTGVCEAQPANEGANCDDGLFCTPIDTCSNGGCVGSGEQCPGQICNETSGTCDDCLVGPDCDDGNVCTDDVCAAGVCSNTDNTASCDDGLFCTATDTCSNGGCVGSGEQCPGQFCNETSSTCDDCLVDADCDDSNVCTDDTCASGACSNTANSDPCDDGLFCTVTDECSAGGCVGSGDPCIAVGGPVASGLVLHLDAGIGVTTSGSLVTGWADQSGSGNDLIGFGDPQLVVGGLNGQDFIEFDGAGDKLEGNTLNGLPAGSADRSMFLVVKYDAAPWFGGLVYGNGALNQAFGLVVNGPNDNLTVQGWGSGNDFVSGELGVGAGWLSQSVVLSGNGISHYLNGGLIDTVTQAFNTNLVEIVIGEEIDNLGFVDIDVAEALVYDRALTLSERAQVEAYIQQKYFGAGGGAECAETCNEAVDNCFDPSGTVCDDVDACTVGDTCTGAGVCGSGTVQDCTGQGDQCNTASCDPGGVVEGNCAILAPVMNGTACDDGDACAVGETCQAGSCGGGGAPDCSNQGDQCNVASCSPAGSEGNCNVLTPNSNGTPCNDGNACLAGESCQAGSCTGGSPPDCSAFSDQCNTAACDSSGAEGNCDDVTPVTDGTTCDDGATCNVGETCQSGSCTGGGAPDCSNQGDQCNVASCDGSGAEGNCAVLTPVTDGAACDDGDVCNVGETCQSGTCGSGGPVDCAGVGGECNTAACDQGGAVGNCDTLAPVADGTTCDDANACSSDDQCVAGICLGQAPAECDDGDPCTVDTCDDTLGCLSDAVPATGCFIASRFSFQIKDKADDSKDQLKWKWLKGEALLQADLGDPLNQTSYALCVYDTTGGVSELATSILVPPNGSWRSKDPKGWKYKDKTTAFDGAQTILLRTGEAAKSRVQLKAKGVDVPMPTAAGPDRLFNEDPEVIVQLVSSDGMCWTSEFVGAKKNEVDQYKGKSQ